VNRWAGSGVVKSGAVQGTLGRVLCAHAVVHGGKAGSRPVPTCPAPINPIQDVCQALWALAVLGVRPGQPLAVALVGRALAQRRRLAPQVGRS
jgi:hypothetical protein